MSDLPFSAAEADALLRLLDDPDPDVQDAVQARLQELGPAVMSHLEAARTQATEPLRTRLGELIHTLHMDYVERAWKAVLDAPTPDLERGALLLALYFNPALDVQRLQTRLDELAERARPLVERFAGSRRALRLSSFLCDDLGFSGNTEDYYNPLNSSLDWVLAHRRGIPITLSVIYLALAARLGLPVYGVNMPAHFLVKYEDDHDELFIDLFHGGTPIQRDEAVQFLLKTGIPPHAHYFAASPPLQVLARMVRNLLHIAEEHENETLATDLTRLYTHVDARV